jgi:glycosyltransferase involved in cell wall biosynthesis
MSGPLISVITPCLNRAQFIREAIRSVMDQNYPDIEHIVVDAVSTDGTLAILNEYPNLRVVSEPDEGMYDAINKGIRMAQGEIIGLLNTDDAYASGCFDAVAEVFEKNPEAQAIVGSATTLDERGKLLANAMPRPTILPKDLWQRVVLGTPVTNAWFFRRDVFEKIGLFDTSYRYVADRDFLIRAVLAGIRPRPIEQPLYCYRSHSGSVTINPLDSRIPERGEQRIKKIWEDIRMYENYLRKNDLPAEVRVYTLKAHDIHCYKLSATAFYHLQWKQAFSAVWHGCCYNSFWPFMFFILLAKRIQKEIGFHA